MPGAVCEVWFCSLGLTCDNTTVRIDAVVSSIKAAQPPRKAVTCRSGGIGRRAWFRSMYPQGCGGSSPFFGTSFFLNTAKNGMRFQIEQAALTAPPRRLDSQTQTSYGGLIGHQKQLSFAELAGIDSR